MRLRRVEVLAADEGGLPVNTNAQILAPHLDAAFGRAVIAVGDDEAIVVSPALAAADRENLGPGQELRVEGVTAGHRGYLGWNRTREWRSGT